MRIVRSDLLWRCRGLTLVELLVALALTAFLLLGLVQMAAGGGATARLQDNRGQLQDQARFAADRLAAAVREAGFRPRPWDTAFDLAGITDETADAASTRGDRLVLRAWSDRNCFDNRNPDVDGDGRPRFYLREQAFDLTGSRHLAWRCRYGPSAGELTAQVRRQGLVPGVESFQLLFGEDADGDGGIERWVRAGHWSDAAAVKAVRIGLLLAGEDSVAERTTRSFEVLDLAVSAPADGRLRRVLELAAALRNRS